MSSYWFDSDRRGQISAPKVSNVNSKKIYHFSKYLKNGFQVHLSAQNDKTLRNHQSPFLQVITSIFICF